MELAALVGKGAARGGVGPFARDFPHVGSTPSIIGSPAAPALASAVAYEEINVADLSNLLRRRAQGLPEQLKVKAADRPTVSFDQWADLPVIDFAEYYTDEASLARKIGAACTEWGFFQLINHGVPPENIQAFREEGFKFFGLPSEEKNKMAQNVYFCQYRANHLNKKLGRTNLLWAESLAFKYKPIFNLDQLIPKVWPEGNPNLRNRSMDFAQSAHSLGDKLLELFALGLGLERDCFAKHFVKTRAQFLRWNYYPPCPDPSAALGIKGHTDPMVFTLVQQDDVGGLQVKRNGVWMGLRPVQDAFVVNVGDILQAWTNNRYLSVEHQVVVNKDKPRLSVAVFNNLGNRDILVKPPAQLIDVDHPLVYRPFQFGEYIDLKYRPKSETERIDMDNGLQALEAFKLQPSKL